MLTLDTHLRSIGNLLPTIAAAKTPQTQRIASPLRSQQLLVAI
jgi:hypothetical protein